MHEIAPLVTDEDYRPVVWTEEENEKAVRSPLRAGQEIERTIRHAHVGELLAELANRYSDRTALVDVRFERRSRDGRRIRAAGPDGRTEWTYHELWKGIEERKNELTAVGAQSGDRIGIIGGNSPEYLMWICGAMLVGEAVPWENHLLEAGLTAAQAMEKAEVRWIIAEEMPAKRLFFEPEGTFIREILANGRLLPIDTAASREMQNVRMREARGTIARTSCERRMPAHPNRPADPRSFDDVAVRIFTSGSSGEQQAVPLTHGNLLYTAMASAGCFEGEEGKSVLQPLPLRHVYGLTSTLAALCQGSVVHLCRAQEDLKYRGKEVMQRVRPQCMFAVPAIASGLMEKIDLELERQCSTIGRIRSRIRSAFACCIIDALAADERRVASSMIDQAVRSALPPELIREVDDYWKGMAVRHRPQTIIDRARHAIGRLLYAKVRRDAGLDRLAGTNGMLICGGGGLCAHIAARLFALGIDNLRNGYGSTQSPIVGQPTVRRTWPFPLMETLPGTTAGIDVRDGKRQLVVSGPQVSPQEHGVWWSGDKAVASDVLCEDGRRRTVIAVSRRWGRIRKNPNGKFIDVEEAEQALCEHPLVSRAYIVFDEKAADEPAGALVELRDPEEAKRMVFGEGECSKRSCNAPEMHRHLLQEFRDMRQSGDMRVPKILCVRVVRFPTIDEQPECFTLKQEFRREPIEETFRGEIEDMFRGGDDAAHLQRRRQ